MKKNSEIVKEFDDLLLIAQNFPAKELEEHVHDRLEIIIPLSGDIRFDFENLRESVGPGRMILIPANTPHRFESSDRNGFRLILLVEDSQIENALDFKSPKVVVTNQLFVELIFHMVLNEDLGYIDQAKFLLTKMIEETIGSDFEIFVSTDKIFGLAKDDRVKKTLKILSEKYNQEDLNLEEVAKSSGYSQRSMRRLFLDELRQSPKQVLTIIRIEEAKKLLLNGNLSITDVCFESGFSSMSAFTQSFKKATGLIPTDFRFRKLRL